MTGTSDAAKTASSSDAQSPSSPGFAFSCLIELQARNLGRMSEPFPFAELRTIVSAWNDVRVLDDTFNRIARINTGDCLSEVWCGAINALRSEIESCAELAHSKGPTWLQKNSGVARVIFDIVAAQQRCGELSSDTSRIAASVVEAAETALATTIRAAADLLASHDSSDEPTKAEA